MFNWLAEKEEKKIDQYTNDKLYFEGILDDLIQLVENQHDKDDPDLASKIDLYLNRFDRGFEAWQRLKESKYLEIDTLIAHDSDHSKHDLVIDSNNKLRLKKRSIL